MQRTHFLEYFNLPQQFGMLYQSNFLKIIHIFEKLTQNGTMSENVSARFYDSDLNRGLMDPTNTNKKCVISFQPILLADIKYFTIVIFIYSNTTPRYFSFCPSECHKYCFSVLSASTLNNICCMYIDQESKSKDKLI